MLKTKKGLLSFDGPFFIKSVINLDFKFNIHFVLQDI